MFYQVSQTPIATLQPGEIRVNDLGDGASTLVQTADGRVLSCQPDGTWQTRDPGANGVFERCVVKQGVATYNPTGPTKTGYVFALEVVPNA